MFGVCFRRETDHWLQDQWSFLFSNFGVSEIWERGKHDARGTDWNIYQPTIAIDTAAELPQDRPVVVLASPLGRYVQGVESLLDFVHPENAIYLFGGSNANLNDEDDLGGRKPDHLVFIPTASRDELHSHAAGYVTLWDRVSKSG